RTPPGPPHHGTTISKNTNAATTPPLCRRLAAAEFLRPPFPLNSPSIDHIALASKNESSLARHLFLSSRETRRVASATRRLLQPSTFRSTSKLHSWAIVTYPFDLNLKSSRK
ncbi:hypothetical protein HAX54_047243, partial [Datura stramonium]|nr:hypothetical protein [Datura stramonium]